MNIKSNNHTHKKTKVMFVCLGNICRSPLAEAVFVSLLEERQQQGEDDKNLVDKYEVDSSGTGSWHIGALADNRMRATAKKHHVNITHSAQQFNPQHGKYFDLILAMDKNNYNDILSIVDQQDKTKVRLFRDWDEQQTGADVPDPYYDTQKGFEVVFDIVKRTAINLLNDLEKKS